MITTTDTDCHGSQSLMLDGGARHHPVTVCFYPFFLESASRLSVGLLRSDIG
jgi:hypothetical protein